MDCRDSPREAAFRWEVREVIARELLACAREQQHLPDTNPGLSYAAHAHALQRLRYPFRRVGE